MSETPWAELLKVWFGETLLDHESIADRMPWWFEANEQRDARLASLFRPVSEQCATGSNYRWLENAEGRLAMIIALDQLPRNLYRGTPRAFANDAYTAALALSTAATGMDLELRPIQRAFLYMPLQHFEDLQAQNRGVELYRVLAEDACDWPEFREGFLPFAELHRDIVAKFGRFPHRNAILGRENTPEETDYLAGEAPSFGQ